MVGIVFDVYVVKEMVKKFNLDVIMLDIEMFKVDGFMFLDCFMKVKFILVVMILMLIEKGVDVIMLVLELGVIDFIFKFKIDV